MQVRVLQGQIRKVAGEVKGGGQILDVVENLMYWMWKMGDIQETSSDKRFELKIKVAVFIKHIGETKIKDKMVQEENMN